MPNPYMLAGDELDEFLTMVGDVPEARAWYELTFAARAASGEIDVALREAAVSRSAGDSLLLAVTGGAAAVVPPHAMDGIDGNTPPAHRYSCDITLLARPDGTPLGLLHLRGSMARVRDTKLSRKQAEGACRAKETVDWRGALRAAGEVANESRAIVVVADRQSNVFSLFAEPRAPHCHLLVRPFGERKLRGHDAELVEAAEAAPVLCEHALNLAFHPSKSPRPARVRIQAGPVTLQPPDVGLRGVAAAPLQLTSLRVKEVDSPAGQKPIDWLLLTDMPLPAPDEAARWVEFYNHRWLVSQYSHVLRNGCDSETSLPLLSWRLERSFLAHCVLAWRVLWLTHPAWRLREEPCLGAVSDLEWRLRYGAEHRTLPSPDAAPPSLRKAARSIAGGGGFLGRKADGDPGSRHVWNGLSRLGTAAFGFFQACRQIRGFAED